MFVAMVGEAFSQTGERIIQSEVVHLLSGIKKEKSSATCYQENTQK